MPNHTLSFDFAAPASQKSAAPRNSLSSNSSTSRRAAKSASAPASSKAENAPKKVAVKAEAALKPVAAKPKAPIAKTAQAVKEAAPKAAKTVVETAVRVSKVAAPKKAMPEEIVAPEVVEKPAVKAKRVRAPKNLAAQYGETEGEDKARPNIEILLEVPKKSRRTAKARAKRHEAMQVDDDLLQRLARAGSASSLVIGEEEPPAVRRSRKWQIMCGKCRHEQSAKTPATLCDCCGTILLRDAARLDD